MHPSSMDDNASSADRTPFARSTGLPASMGKATADLKCKVPDCVKDEFTRLAHILGLSESELLRELVMLRLYGAEQVSRMHAERMRLVAGTGPLEVSA